MIDGDASNASEAGLAATLLDDLDKSAVVSRTRMTSGTLVWRSWGEGVPLILLHGATGSWRHWARNIRHFAAHRRVIIPDLPGMGDSDLPPEPMALATTAAVLMEGLPSLTGDSRWDIAGFSYGGAVAGLAAGLATTRVRSLFLIGPGGFGLPVNFPTPVRLRGLEGPARRAAHRANLEHLMIADPARIDALALEIQEQNTARNRLPRVYRYDQALLPAGFGQYNGPCSAIWGAKDSFVLGHLHTRIDVLRTSRPDADIRVVPDAGHWVAYEAADLLNRHLEARLDAVNDV